MKNVRDKITFLVREYGLRYEDIANMTWRQINDILYRPLPKM
jgi:hypothetical protein